MLPTLVRGSGVVGAVASFGNASEGMARVGQLVGGLESLLLVLGEHHPDDLEQLALFVGVHLRDGQLLHDVLVADGEGVLAVEGHHAGEALVGHDAE
jgi:hypothetical protein